MRATTVALLLFVLCNTPALAGDGSLDAAAAKAYFPLDTDVRWRYAVKPRGRAHVTHAAEVEKIDGKKYTKQTTVISLPGSRATPQTVYQRLTSSGLMQYDGKTKTEQVLVPFPLKPGQTWITKTGGGDSHRKYVGMFTHRMMGLEWPDTIKIVADEGQRTLEMYYVKDLGLLGTISKSGRTISLRSELIEVEGGKPAKVFAKKVHTWRPYQCDDGQLVVDLPGTPHARSTRVKLGGTKSISAHQSGLKRDGETGFMVIHYKIPDGFEKPTNRKVLDATAQAALKYVGGKVLKDRSRGASQDFGGEKLRGRELKATVVRSGSEIRVVIRVLHSKQRGFQLIAFGNKKDMPKKDASKFLRSLRAPE